MIKFIYKKENNFGSALMMANKLYDVKSSCAWGDYFSPYIANFKPRFLSPQWRAEKEFKKIMIMVGLRPIINKKMRQVRYIEHMNSYMFWDAGGTKIHSLCEMLKHHPDYNPFNCKTDYYGYKFGY